MNIKKVLLGVLMLFTFTSSVAFGQGTTTSAGTQAYNDAAINNVLAFVNKAYVKYYDINAIKGSVSDSSISGNVFTAQVNVSLTKTLKAKSVDDLPYVKGMKNKSNTLKSTKGMNALDIDQVVNNKIKDLNQYIGTPSDQNDSFRFTANIVNGAIDAKNTTLEFLNVTDWIPASYFIPDSDTKMVNNGEKDLLDAVTINKDFTIKKQTQQTSLSSVQPYSTLTTFTIDRIAARNYANTYTSQVGTSYNTAYWNPNYVWHTENGGVDCANYVSQSLYAGGMPSNSTWQPESLAWVNTGYSNSGGLIPYLVNQGIYYSASKSTTAAGGIIFSTAYSHAMLVVANDTVTMQYSSHTNDEKQASFASFGSGWAYYYISAAYGG